MIPTVMLTSGQTAYQMFGQPLRVPSKQTMLPVIGQHGQIYGYYPIAETTFVGTETTFTLASGTIPVTTVTVHDRGTPSFSVGLDAVPQYMAAKFENEYSLPMLPWAAHSEFVSADNQNFIGYYSWWSMPEVTTVHHYGRGALINSLMLNLAEYGSTDPGSTNPTPPSVTSPQAYYWDAPLNFQSLINECTFFDFRWDTLFETSIQEDKTQAGNSIVPLTLNVVSNPAGGEFKASLVTGLGGQTVVAGGGIMFNTVRVLQLKDAAPGTYTFNFEVSATFNDAAQATVIPVVFTVTVAAE